MQAKLTKVNQCIVAQVTQVRAPGTARIETRSAYVYAILIDGMVRYIGKGRDGRMYAHVMDARRSAARCGGRTTQLSPRLHRRLVEAVRSGAKIKEKIIVGGLTDRRAYQLEYRLIAEFHKFWTDQLWNTIDERFMDPRWLPEEWQDPENSLYRLPRPLARTKSCKSATKPACRLTGTARAKQPEVETGVLRPQDLICQ